MKKLLILSIILSSLFGNSQCNLLQYGNLDFAETCGGFSLPSTEWTWQAASGTPDKYCWQMTGPSDQLSNGIPFENLAQPTVVCSVWNNDDSNLGFMGLAARENNSNAEYARGEFISALLPGVYNITFKAKILSRQITYGSAPIEFTTTYPIKIRVGTSSQAMGNTTNNDLSFPNTISSGFISYTEDCEWQSISLVLNNSLTSQQYFYIGIDESTMTQTGSIQYVLIDDILVTQETNFQFSADVFCTNEDIDPSNVFGVDVISAESGGVDINDLQAGVHDLTITFLDNFGCEHVEIIQDVSFVNSAPVNINVTPSESVCPGTEINVSVDNLNNTNWSSPADLAGSSSNSFDYLVGTDDVTFSVSGVDVNGCSTYGEIAIEVFPEIVVNTNIVQAPCESGGLGSISIQILGGQSPFVYKWIQNGEIVLLNSPLLNYPPGDYQLVVQDANGCEFIEEYTIGVDADFYSLEINSQNEADLFLNYTLLTIANDLVFNITSGENTVNVDHSHIAFGPNGKLIIREGSKVRFTECTLTACSSTWKGVRVESDNSTVADAGKIIIENSYIEKARIGILTFDANAFNTDESQHRCGKLDVKNTQFNDCWRALEVQYGLVDNTSNGTLNLCDIRMSQNYYNYWDDFVSQCQFYGVQNFVVQNTTILNDTWQLQWNSRGSGIGGINAKIKVIGDNTLDAKIAGFDRGMDMLTTWGIYNGLEVTGYKFERNHQAILLNNTCYHTIAENVFEVGTDMNINQWNGSYINAEGIVMLGGAYFNISENIFHGIMETAVGEAQGPIGIRIRDSFTQGDMVYKNTFDGFLVANLANGYNFNAEQGNGLRYSCNLNSNNVFDFQVSHELNDLIISPFEDFGIGVNQVNVSLLDEVEKAVENDFTDLSFSDLALNGQFYNAGMEIDYFSNILVPTSYTEASVNVSQAVVFNNDCAFSFNAGLIVEDFISVPNVLVELDQLNDNIFQLDFLIASLVDGGDHNELIQEIDFTVSQNLLQVRDRLISASPFVSMEVFLHLLDKPETFTNLFCLEILMLNPDLLRSEKLFNILTGKESPFTTEQIELLRSLRSSKDMKWELLHERDVQALLKFDIELGLRMKSIDEGTISESDYLSVDMTHAEYSEGMMKLDALLAGKNYTLAQTELAIFKQNTKSPVIRQHINDYSEWITFCVQLDSIGMDFTSLSEEQMFFLREHSINSSWSGRIAQKLLEYYYNEDGYSNPFVDYRMFNQSRNYVITEEINADLLYPNPANDLVYLSIIENEVNFQILNSLGQVVMENMYFSGEPIDISALPVGQYILKMLDTSISPMRFTKL